MSVTIDSLDIQIRSSAGSAAKNIDELAKSLGNLNSNAKITKVINSLNSLNNALSNMKSQQAVMSQLSALSKSLSHLAAIPKLTGLQSAIRELKKLPDVMASLDTAQLSQFTAKMRSLANGLSPLATQIDKIGNGFAKLPPQVSKCVTAVKRLDSANQSASHSARAHGEALNSQSFNLLAAYENLENVLSIIHAIQDAFASLMDDAIQWDGIQFRFGRAFGDDAEMVLEHAQRVSDELRINMQQFMQYSSLYGSLLSGFGMEQEKVSTISMGLTELSYDIWAAYNDRYRTLEDASEAIRSAITGEIEPIRNAGIALTEASMQEYLDSIGMAAMSVEKLTEAQKSELRYAVMVNSAMKQGIVGTYAREMDTAEGTIRTLTQQLKTLGQALGSLFLPILQAVIPWLTAFVELLTEGISALAAMFGIEFQKIQWGDASGMKQTAEGAGATADALGDAAKSAKKMKDYALGFDELNVISPDSGSDASGGAGAGGSGGGGGGGLGLDLDTLWDDAVFASVSDKIDKIKEKMKPFFDWMKENGKDVLDIVLNIGGAFLGWKMASGLIQNIRDVIANLKEMDKLSKVTLGLSLAVSGITLAYQGGFDIAYEGPTLMNVIKAALGSALSIAGSLLIFGTGPAGWAVGIGVALTALITGVTLGTKKKNLIEDQVSHFGEYVLSKDELQEMVESITAVDVSARLSLHVDQVAIVTDAKEALETAMQELRTLNLKLEIGLAVSQETYSAAVDRLVESITTYISEKQVEYALAIDVTLDGTSTGSRLTEFSNTFFLEAQGKLTDLGNKLKSVVSTGFVKGEWIPEKLQEAIELQKEIQEVLDYVSDKEFQAKMAALKLDASGTTLSYQSMEQLLEQANETISEKMKDLEAVRIQQIQIAQMEFDQNMLKGMSKAEAQKILDTTLTDIQTAFLSSQVELNLGPVTFGLDSIASAYSKELALAVPVMQRSVEELFMQGTMAVLPDQTYENVSTLVMQLRDAYTIGLEQLDISDAARKNMEQLLAAMKPTLEDLSSVAEEARKAGQTVPEEVSKGLSDAAQLAAVAGDTEAINYLIGEKLSKDSSFLNMLATAEDAGMSVDDSMAKGLLNNIEYVKDQATGVVTGIKNSMTGEVVAITPTMVSNFEQLGVDVSDGLFDGANKQMASKKTSWLDWAIWPWNWFKEKNEINSPSKLFERGGESLGEGLLKGVKNKWEDIKTWYNLNVAPKFTMAYWLDKFSGIKDGFKQTIKNAINNGITLMNKFIGWINEKMAFSWDAVKVAGKEIVPAGSIQLFTIPLIPKFEQGGFLEDGLFTMNRGEIAGKFNNGKSVVANNQQIVEGIAAGVYEAVVAAMNATSGRGEQSVNVYLDGKQIATAVEKRQSERGRTLMGNQLGYVY